MIISNSTIKLESTHELDIRHQESVLRRVTTRQTSPESRRSQENETATPRQHAPRQTAPDGVKVTLAQLSGIQYSHHASTTESISNITEDPEEGSASEQRSKLKVLLKTLEKMTGKAYHFSEVRFQPDTNSSSAESQPMVETSTGAPPRSGEPPIDSQNNAPSRIETITAYRHSENEKTGFEASGTIKTADGREIEIDIQLNMSRKFHEAAVTHTVERRPLTDPLVISLDGGPVDLTETKYAFDLNSDGVGEKISFVTPGTGGFLAYDRNKDGVINNGSELFGPTRGNGFSELAAYDKDRNGWIDEKDGIYYDLSIWSKTPEGKDQLIAVADTGIGAIYLNAAETPFAVTTNDNERLGQVQRSSVYLNENGSAGVIQQVDLVG